MIYKKFTKLLCAYNLQFLSKAPSKFWMEDKFREFHIKLQFHKMLMLGMDIPLSHLVHYKPSSIFSVNT